jgi:alginate O-acetyltransferase complex protein AlgI
MLFSSMTFIYVFMPILCVIYFVLPKKFNNTVLLIASLTFYAWGEPRFLLVMLFTILINYVVGILIESSSNRSSFQNKFVLTVGILLNLSILGYFKYFNFIVENIGYVFKVNFDLVKVVLPLGISFYTFQSLSYLVDIYRGEAKAQKNIFKLALFITLFPQLIAGPIVKYQEICDQLDNRKVYFDDLIYGVKRFIIGLSKKMLIANTCGEIADKIFIQNPENFSTSVAWLGAISYTLQIYFDFSGYSDMAIGLGHIFGFKFKENFNYPYISKTITEFWRRWHISLSTWFKQYLYIPLGGNRISPKRTYVNLFIVFLATGVWHGASWNFVVWGLWNAFFIIIERYFCLNKESKRSVYKNVILHIYCILAFIFGWVLFRADDLTYAVLYMQNMLGLLDVKNELYTLLYYVDTIPLVAIIAGIILSTPVCSRMIERTASGKAILLYGYDFILLVLFFVCTAFIASSTYNPFIYFRF